MSKKTSILLVEDHPMMIEGIRERVKSAGQICDVAHNTGQLLALYNSYQPDIVLCDVTLAVDNGVAATRQLLHQHQDARVLMFSSDHRLSTVRAALDAGAAGYVRKTTSCHTLIECIEDVASGVTDVFDRGTASALLREGSGRRERGSAGVDLTERQREILTFMSLTGRTATKDIADRFCISQPTVRTHMTRLFQALGVNSRASAVQAALSSGLVDLPARRQAHVA